MAASAASKYGSRAAPTQSAQAIVIVELFDIADAERMSRALAIRLRVFVEEQSVPPDEEVDAHDRTDTDAVHAIALDETGRPTGTGRF